jgi:hypothetical protein
MTAHALSDAELGSVRSITLHTHHYYNANSSIPIPLPGVIERELTGTIGELLIDRSGVFEGFVLCMEQTIRPFMTREIGIRRIVLHAYNEQIPVSVCFDGARDRIYKILLRT